MALRRRLGAAALLLVPLAASTPSPRGLNADLTILMDNDLAGSNNPLVDSAVILLSSSSYQDAVAGCEALNEALWSPEQATASIQSSLDYLVYDGKAIENSQFWVASLDDSTRAISASGNVSVVDSGLRLPALCTQSAPLADASSTDNGTEWQISVRSNNDDLVGFRDRTSFRFYGIRYAAQPERFEYSELYNGSNSTVSALSFGDECAQGTDTGSEDCFFLNVWTPHLPNPSSNSSADSLKPVMFWIHGGGFSGGSGSDNTFDGGSLASRGDVVVVTINYRLGTFGFLALNDSVTNGNYGIADQITALDWVRAHIEDFGGDPDRITIFGQSAGGVSVKALMETPQTAGKFAGAIPQSSLGGLGTPKYYSEYYTIDQAMEAAGSAVIAAANCTDAASWVECLRELSTEALLNLGATATYVVVDGTYIPYNHLQLDKPDAPYRLMMGVMRDDGATISFPSNTTNVTEYIETALGLEPPPADLFPIPDGANKTLNLFNMTARYMTDATWRCISQATVWSALRSGMFASAYYYEFDRSYQLANWPGTDVCQPPVTATHPDGDPSAEYFKCHSGDLYEVFGNVAFQGLPFRDEADQPFEQYVVDAWASFARTGDPNPDPALLAARGYANTSGLLERFGRWVPAVDGNFTVRVLDDELRQIPPREQAQCDGLGLPLDYWESK